MPARKVKPTKMGTNDFFPNVEPCSQDLEKLQISEYHRMYFALSRENGGWSLYKLHRIYFDADSMEKGYRDTYGKRKYIFWIWIAMWNSSSWTSIYIDGKSPKNQGYYNSMEEALSAALKDNWKICQMNYDNMEWIINAIKHEHGIREDK